MNEQEFRELSAGRALGALSPDDESRFFEALASHPEWRAIAEEDERTVLLLDLSAPEVAPPPALRDEILGLTALTPQHVDAPNGRTAPVAPATPAPSQQGASESGTVADPAELRPRRKPARLFALAASLVLIAGLGAGIWAQTAASRDAEPPAVVALAEVEDAADAAEFTTELSDGGTATLHWSAELGKAVLVADGLPEITEEQAFELWVVRGDTPVSAGLMQPDGTSGLALLDGELERGDLVAVTVESAKGSPTGAPTTDPILAVATA